MARVTGEGAESLKSAISEPRRAFWLALIASAVAEGLLRPDADPEVLQSPIPMFTFRDVDGNTLYIVQEM